MSKTVVANHLKKAEKNILIMMDMLNNNDNCINVLLKSKEAQLEIESARRILIDGYLEKCVSEWLRSNKQENIDELIKVFNYR